MISYKLINCCTHPADNLGSSWWHKQHSIGKHSGNIAWTHTVGRIHGSAVCRHNKPFVLVYVCIYSLQAATKLGHQDQVCLMVEEAGGMRLWCCMTLQLDLIVVLCYSHYVCMYACAMYIHVYVCMHEGALMSSKPAAWIVQHMLSLACSHI